MDYKKYYEKYMEDGCIKIENFLSPAEVDLLKQGLADMVESMPEDVHVHTPYSKLKKTDGSSKNKIGYIFENNVVDSDGNFKMEKKKALKYIAYDIHWLNPQCKQVTFSKKMKDLFRAFGYKDPVICQSMLVFKNPNVEEVFEPSQDSNFFYTEPPSCICFWMPLEDTSIENGCLWFLPGSHKSGKIYQRFERTSEKDPTMVIRGKLPDFDEDQYIPITTNKGDIGILHGATYHKGSKNKTDKQRAVYVLFAVEKESKWSKLNEGQAGENRTFSSVYDI